MSEVSRRTGASRTIVQGWEPGGENLPPPPSAYDPSTERAQRRSDARHHHQSTAAGSLRRMPCSASEKERYSEVAARKTSQTDPRCGPSTRVGRGGGIVSLPPRSVTAGPISPRTIGKWISTDEAYIRRFQVPTPPEDIPMCFAAPATPPTESEPGGDVTGDSDPHPPYTRAETRLMKGSVRYWSFFAGRKMAYRVPRREGARHPSDTAGICRRSWGDLLQRLPVGSTMAFVQGRAEIQVPSSASRRSPSLRSYRAHRL